MAEIASANGGHRKPRGRRTAKVAPRVDMTPMVDLGFLLITFFMLSMKMSQPTGLEVIKPAPVPKPEPIPACCVLNILVDSADQIFTYDGDDLNTLISSSLNDETGLMHAVIVKGKKVKTECSPDKSGKPRQLICLIKLLPGTRFQNLTDVVDIMDSIKPTYSIQEPLPEEIEALKAKEKELLASK